MVLRIDETLYRRDSVLRAAYWFTDRCYLFLTRPSPGIIEVQIRSKPGYTLQTVIGEFSNALLDHQLRHEIEEQTGAIRELLVAKAFGAAPEEEPPGNPNDPVDNAVDDGLVRISRAHAPR